MPSEPYLDKERITRLETKVENNFQTQNSNNVLFTQIQATLQQIGQTLAVIVSKQDDFKDYQKTCEAERKAHEIRLAALENAKATSEIERKTERKTFIQILNGQAGLIAIILSMLTLYFSVVNHKL